MKRRNFLKAASALSVVSATGMASTLKHAKSFAGAKEMYEWRIYTLTDDGKSLDAFFEKTLIPAYNRKNIKAGAFKPYKQKDGESDQRHLLLIYPDIETYLTVKKTIWDDREFRQKAQAFFDESAPKPVYSNFVSYLSEAFDIIPVHRKPDASRGLFEIRIYRSPNEEANQRKVAMFNKGEVDVFDKTGIHSVMYGEILSGPRMPALMYLTWYKNEQTRTEAWDKFRVHPDWLHLRALPEYANTATDNQSTLLSPMPYSQI